MSMKAVHNDFLSQGHEPLSYGARKQAGSYGASPALSEDHMAYILGRGQRQRLNVVSILTALVVPWVLFVACYTFTSSSFRYFNPRLVFGAVVFLGLLVLGVGLNAWSIFMKKSRRESREPEWTIFMFFTMLTAWVMGVILGGLDFTINTQIYYDYNNLESYTGVDPQRIRGQQIMDAGRVYFANTTMLDKTKSMGFKNFDTYCVAPITHEGLPLASYDLWAVGLNCCSDHRADFRCSGHDNPHAKAGLRLLRDDTRAFFRLAVQQAEAAYNIKADHPLFFFWTEEPAYETAAIRDDAYKYFVVAMCVHFAWQSLCVAMAAYGFWKLGHR